MAHNFVRPFLFEHLDVRGACVHLGDVWQALQARRGYAPPVARLLGEMAAVTALIAANLKQPGRMSFQLQGQGPVRLLVLDCDEQLRLRGMARADAGVAEATVPDLLGHGQLALTLDSVGMRQPYQSLVPLDGDSIAGIFEHYLERSEQLPARLFLMADGSAAAGLFLQKLPDADRRDPDGWRRVQILAETVRAEELGGLTTLQLLGRLFPEEDIRLFDPRPVTYHCPEDWGKVESMLRSLGRDECEAVLREHGEIHIHDEICGHDYRFDAGRVAELFGRDRHV
ncbi:Hsp33 family molecular chaperone HslO [Parasulfuritortus cantonensis]|uniref:Hsp33 family molecular chaperone HslO n=1 Tax=Parasulfuritortus cantonensis TaxID=2528202 RepID=A0A4R1BDB1_9PROT|nr:Hsp33 family molecular chaperone HslO [Parasulfuritortus cantonensis]